MTAATCLAPSAARLGFVDLIRGLAILHVLLYHAAVAVSGDLVRWHGWWWDPQAFGALQSSFQALFLQTFQVPTFFFLISGFLIHSSRRRKPTLPVAEFLLRRGARLYVPYLIALLVFLVVIPVYPTAGWSLRSVLDVIAHVTLTFNLHDSTLWTINASFWYVATELQLFVLYPLLARVLDRVGWTRGMLALGLLEFAARCTSTVTSMNLADGGPLTLGDDWLARSFPAYCFTWMLGAWVAERQFRGELRRPAAWQFVLWPAAAVATALIRPLTVIAPMFVAAGVAALLAQQLLRTPAMHAGADSHWRTAWAWMASRLAVLGSISYGIYLLNQPLLFGFKELLRSYVSGPLTLIALLFCVAVAVMLPVGFVFSRYVEAPSGAWVQRRLDRLFKSGAAPRPRIPTPPRLASTRR